MEKQRNIELIIVTINVLYKNFAKKSEYENEIFDGAIIFV